MSTTSLILSSPSATRGPGAGDGECWRRGWVQGWCTHESFAAASRSLVVIILMILVAIVGGAVGASARAHCSVWDIAGRWEIRQSNQQFDPVFDLTVRPDGVITGTAQSSRLPEPYRIVGIPIRPGVKRAELGDVDGSLRGDALTLNVYWDYNAVGVYEGSINASGRVEGVTYNRNKPAERFSWHSVQRFPCSRNGADAPPAEMIGPGMEPDTNRVGSDYRGFDLGSRSPEACQRACKDDPETCRAWTYVRPEVQGPNARCYLKTDMPAPNSDACCISGIERPFRRLGRASESGVAHGQETGVNRPGADYRSLSFSGVTPAVCQRACRSEADSCRAWTFVRAGVQGADPVCHLKTSVPAAVRDNCCTSGVEAAQPEASTTPAAGATLFEEGTDRPGADIARIVLSSPEPEQCRLRCVQLAECSAWTMVKPGIHDANAVCYLKHTASPPVSNACCISGTKQ